MFRSSHCDYTYIESADDSDSDTDLLTAAFTEASETDGSTGTDTYVISGPKTPEQQIAEIKSKLDSGSLDMVALEKLLGKIDNLRLEGVPSGFEEQYYSILNTTSHTIGDMGNVQFTPQIYSHMADLGIAPKHFVSAPEITQVFAPAPSLSMIG